MPPSSDAPPPGFGQPPPGYGQQPSGYGQPPPGYGQPGYGGYSGSPDRQGRPLASWGKRVGAAIVDFLILAVPLFVIISVIFGVDFNAGSDEDGAGFSLSASLAPSLLGFVLSAAYYVYFTGGESGQTLGKKLLGIAVRDAETGGPLGYGKSGLRYLVQAGPGSFCFLWSIVDSLWPLWDQKNQAIHDKAVNTLVVEVPK